MSSGTKDEMKRLGEGMWVTHSKKGKFEYDLERILEVRSSTRGMPYVEFSAIGERGQTRNTKAELEG